MTLAKDSVGILQGYSDWFKGFMLRGLLGRLSVRLYRCWSVLLISDQNIILLNCYSFFNFSDSCIWRGCAVLQLRQGNHSVGSVVVFVVPGSLRILWKYKEVLEFGCLACRRRVDHNLVMEDSTLIVIHYEIVILFCCMRPDIQYYFQGIFCQDLLLENCHSFPSFAWIWIFDHISCILMILFCSN